MVFMTITNQRNAVNEITCGGREYIYSMHIDIEGGDGRH